MGLFLCFRRLSRQGVCCHSHLPSWHSRCGGVPGSRSGRPTFGGDPSPALKRSLQFYYRIGLAVLTIYIVERVFSVEGYQHLGGGRRGLMQAGPMRTGQTIPTPPPRTCAGCASPSALAGSAESHPNAADRHDSGTDASRVEVYYSGSKFHTSDRRRTPLQSQLFVVSLLA